MIAPDMPHPQAQQSSALPSAGAKFAGPAQIVGRELAAFNQHDLDAVAAGFSAEARIITGHRGPPVEGTLGVRIYVADQYARFPGLALEMRSCLCTPAASSDSGDVWCDVHWHGHWHDPDSGQLVGRRGGGSFHVVGGKIVELRLLPRHHDGATLEVDSLGGTMPANGQTRIPVANAEEGRAG